MKNLYVNIFQNLKILKNWKSQIYLNCFKFPEPKNPQNHKITPDNPTSSVFHPAPPLKITHKPRLAYPLNCYLKKLLSTTNPTH